MSLPAKINDLSTPAIKIARRLQNLSSGKTYAIILVKLTKASWIVTIEEKGKAEVLKE